MDNRQSHSQRLGAQSPALFIGFTLAAAFTAALAAFASVAFALPVWAMFIGWVAYFTRGHSLRDGATNLVCVVIGIALGIGAMLSIAALQPVAGIAALPVVVFAVAAIVVSLRAAPAINNLLGYFLGLIAFFASHLEPALATLLHLSAAGALGGLAAWLSTRMQAGLLRTT